MRIKVLIADDHQITREGLRRMLEQEHDMEVLGVAEDGAYALKLARELAPDVIVMDICMPNVNGILATNLIRSELPKIKVVALSMLSDRHFVYKMLQAGASGYLLKDCSFLELAYAVRLAAANKTYLSPGIADLVVKGCVLKAVHPEESADGYLSCREQQVLQLIAEGKSTNQIAGALYLSVKTVETHRTHIMEKLNLKSVARLTKYAIREGLTSA